MLAAVGPCSQRTLSEELRIDRSVMVGIADDLESHGYVRRERDPGDRRAYAVTLTAAGKRALTAAERTVPAFLDRTFAALTPANATSSRLFSENSWPRAESGRTQRGCSLRRKPSGFRVICSRTFRR